MRLRYIFLLFVVPAVFACLGFRSEFEYIAINDISDIHLINIRGNIEHTIHLPMKMTHDFYLDKENVFFYGEDKKLHIYDWKNKKKKDNISGPFFFKAKNYGPEIYYKITAWNNIIGFLITPEYYDSLGNPEELKNFYSFPEMLQDSRVGIYDVDKKQFSLVRSEKGYSDTLILYKESLIDCFGFLYKYDIINNKEESIYDPEKNNKYKESYRTILLGIYSSKIYYAFTDYFGQDKRIYKIVCLDIDKKTDKILYDLKKTKIGEDIYGIIRSPSRISKDEKKLIWIDEENNVVIYNLSKRKKETIYSGKNVENLTIQFYYDNKIRPQ